MEFLWERKSDDGNAWQWVRGNFVLALVHTTSINMNRDIYYLQIQANMSWQGGEMTAQGPKWQCSFSPFTPSDIISGM